ncbi:MAG: sugar O-acyltransferase, sialic acid O-acetyltransferase NeuD family [uncultured bacterium]|nr:MAG: sugar O-acyltransferase, sialic acid O-acetyltransferase NeuD family [uncultured bacterium]
MMQRMSMKNKISILIVGAGAHGRVVLDTLRYQPVNVKGFIDDNIKKGTYIDGVPVLGKCGDLGSFFKIDLQVVVAIGNNFIRSKIFSDLYQLGFTPYSVIHPSAIISPSVKLGKGVIIFAGVVINTGTMLGDNVNVNTSASIDHDCLIEEHVHIYPGTNLAGNVRVKQFSYLGTGSAVNPNITIGRNVLIGTGAAVVKDIPDNVTAVGVPARILKTREALY